MWGTRALSFGSIVAILAILPPSAPAQVNLTSETRSLSATGEVEVSGTTYNASNADTNSTTGTYNNSESTSQSMNPDPDGPIRPIPQAKARPLPRIRRSRPSDFPVRVRRIAARIRTPKNVTREMVHRNTLLNSQCRFRLRSPLADRFQGRPVTPT